MNQPKIISDISEDELLNLEKNLVWSFTSIGTTNIVNWLFTDYANIVNEFLLGQHLGIITDRRGTEIVTSYDIHRSKARYLFCDKFRNTWLYYLRNLILGRLYYQFKQTKKQVIINDLPAANFASKILTDATPHSKVLIFVRDPRDVLNFKTAELNDANKVIQSGLSTFSKNNKLEFIKLEARKMAKMISTLMMVKETHSKNLVMLVKFEDLIGNTGITINKICEFLGIKIEQNELQIRVSKIQKNLKNITEKFGSWHENFSSEEKQVINALMSDYLNKLKYN